MTGSVLSSLYTRYLLILTTTLSCHQFADKEMGPGSFSDLPKVMEDGARVGTQVRLTPELMLLVVYSRCWAQRVASDSDFQYDY